MKKSSRKRSLKRTKRSRTAKNRRIRGGYTEEDKGTWSQVTFTEEEKQDIRDYAEKYAKNYRSRTVPSTVIRDSLFPRMPEKLKNNAAWEIQVVLGRDYSGR